MTTSHPKEIPLSLARSNLAELANSVAFAKKRAILTRNGKKVAALISIEDLETLEAIEDRIDLEDAREALADAKKRGTISWGSIKKKLKL